MLRILSVHAALLGGVLGCTEQEKGMYRQYFPDLVPDALQDINFNGDEMEWASHVTNVGHDFRYLGNMQQVVDFDGRVVCEEGTPKLIENFRIYTAQGVFISQSNKEVSCLMDSYGGSNQESLFTGAHCGEGVMGISSGGTDLYDRRTADQRLSTRGFPIDEVYIIVNTLNPAGTLQLSANNDISFTSFRLRMTNQGKQAQVIEACNGNQDCAARLRTLFEGDNNNNAAPRRRRRRRRRRRQN